MRILVDMSATLIHHGHIRLLKKAAQLGKVVVGLTEDHEIRLKKGYTPELNYKEREEILSSIKYVSEIIPCKWLIDDEFMEYHKIDLLVHGSDNSNNVNANKMITYERTDGISSTELRRRACKILNSAGNQ